MRPAQAFVTALTRKRRERAAMRGIETIIAQILGVRRRDGHAPDDYLQRIAGSFGELPEAEADVNAARDVMLIHMGAQSNLYAALAWTLVNLLLHPQHLARVRAGDDVLLEQSANESIRLAQRSITLRYVMTPLAFDDGRQTYRLDPGVMITTMLPVNNASAAGLHRSASVSQTGGIDSRSARSRLHPRTRVRCSTHSSRLAESLAPSVKRSRPGKGGSRLRA